MDIKRLKDKKTKMFRYFDNKSKKYINDKNILNRINNLKIPPAYTNVIISKKHNSKIQAIGFDSKKRPQYIYNKDFIEQQKKLKFSDLVYFGKKIKRIRKDINLNLKNCYNNNLNILNKKCIISIILYLIDKCNFRVGCDKYQKLYNTIGATTLNKTHIKKMTNSISINFIGKKGVHNSSTIKNPMICSLLLELCNINDKDFLFYYMDESSNKYRITERHINQYLKKYHKSLSVKMFRTWSANYILLKEILNLDLPNSVSEAKRNINKAVKKAAFHMHHTAHVSKKSYMNNEIINLYLEDYNKFKKLIEYFRKENGNLPNIDRLLNLILSEINKNNKK